MVFKRIKGEFLHFHPRQLSTCCKIEVNGFVCLYLPVMTAASGLGLQMPSLLALYRAQVSITAMLLCLPLLRVTQIRKHRMIMNR